MTMDDKLIDPSYFAPPHNEEAEQVILGALLVNNGYFRHLTGLKPEHFFDPVNGRIYAIICQMIGSKTQANPITLKARLTDSQLADMGGTGYLARLSANVATVANINDYAAVVIDAFVRREIIALSRDMTAKATDIAAGVTGAEVASQTIASLVQIANATSEDEIQDAGDVFDRLQERMAGGATIYQTAIAPLDFAMGGGLHAGRVYGFLARQKTGKTTLLSTIAYNLLDRREPVPHLFLSLEQQPEAVLEGMVARKLMVNAEDLRSGNISRAAADRLDQARGFFAGRGMYFRSKPRMSLDDLRSMLARVAMSGKVRGVILDYYQLVSGRRRDQSTADHLDNVGQTLAEAAANYGLWILTAAQTNREGEIRGGDGLLNACDQAYLLGRHECSGHDEAWLEMRVSRYNRGAHVGTEDSPRLIVRDDIGPYFEERRE